MTNESNPAKAGDGERLLPCPWCGTVPDGCEHRDVTGEGYYAVQCASCNPSRALGDPERFCGVYGHDVEAVHAAWNRRTPAAPLMADKSPGVSDQGGVTDAMACAALRGWFAPQYSHERDSAWGSTEIAQMRRALEAAERARAAQAVSRVWQPMETAPKDRALLLKCRTIDSDEFGHSTEDDEEWRTIGHWQDDADLSGGYWQVAGWCWCHDEFTDELSDPEKFEVIGWMEMP